MKPRIVTEIGSSILFDVRLHVDVVLFSGEVKLNYLKRPYFVTMGLFLMAVLLPFNSSDNVTFRELLDVTQLPTAELARHVQQLIEVGILKADVSIETSWILTSANENALKC